MAVKNSKGKIFYGMHFYSGLAEYQDPGRDPYRVYLNEDTLRKMDPTFAGRPIFVEHVDEVSDNIDEVKEVADGWVVESFFNQADGKHWVKFIVVSERGEKAIEAGMRLSNAYLPKSWGEGGLWNGIAYEKEVTSGEFEHLAIVRSPRYEESVIMTPEKFKAYNEGKIVELKRLANSKDEGDKMAFKLFKKTKVENALDIEGMCVTLPKSGKEVVLTQLINEADEHFEKVKKNEVMADPSHKVAMHDGSMMSVGELMAKHKEMKDSLESMKKDGDEEVEEGEKDLGDHGGDESLDNEDDESMDNDEDSKAKLKAKEDEKAVDEAKKKNAREKAERLKNARENALLNEEIATVETSDSQLERGKKLF